MNNSLHTQRDCARPVPVPAPATVPVSTLARAHGARLAPHWRLAWVAGVCVALSACSAAPGMRMVTPATLPQTSAQNGDPVTQVEVPMTTIDLELIRRMRAATSQDHALDKLDLFGKPGPYQLGAGDVLQITVWDHPELAAALGQPVQPQRPVDAASGFLVDESGNIQFPYVGDVHVAGDTVDQAQRKIYQRLSTVFMKPQLTVRVASFRAAQVYIDGEVRAPGAQTINDIPMTLTEALNRAGGFSPNADQSRVVIVRNGVSYPINVAAMIAQGKNPAQILLKGGDMLRVVSRDDDGVYLMGEINKPATVIPNRNGSLTLSDALSQAGSINTGTADAKQLYVIRGSMSDKPQIYHLDATSPVSMLLANQFQLEPQDVVYLDSSGLVRFSRILNLLLPAINAGLTGAIVTK